MIMEQITIYQMIIFLKENKVISKQAFIRL
jgi:hypothetical protein